MRSETRYVFKAGVRVDDPWFYLDAQTPSEWRDFAAAPLKRFLEYRSSIENLPREFGVIVEPDDELGALEPYLSKLSLIVIEFSKFTDGRGFSQARLLRERMAYRGELRARGDILIDQAAFLLRCGFDSLEFADAIDEAALHGAVTAISVQYQPAADGVAPAYISRHRAAPTPARAQRKNDSHHVEPQSAV